MSRQNIYIADSLQNRIRQFFLNNPDEELTYKDMAIKFDCTPDAAKTAIRELKNHSSGAFETVHIGTVVRFKQPAAEAA